ncbi:hypothetical protein WMY93_033004, partial [Mugilogobius chulae]
ALRSLVLGSIRGGVASSAPVYRSAVSSTLDHGSALATAHGSTAAAHRAVDVVGVDYE